VASSEADTIRSSSIQLSPVTTWEWPANSPAWSPVAASMRNTAGVPVVPASRRPSGDQARLTPSDRWLAIRSRVSTQTQAGARSGPSMVSTIRPGSDGASVATRSPAGSKAMALTGPRVSGRTSAAVAPARSSSRPLPSSSR
jgi:hypothetical protein